MTEEELLQVIEQAAAEGWTELDLSGKELTALPPEMGQLTNLQTLNLRSNQLSSLPETIKKLTKLEKLDLRRNPVPIPPEFLGAKEFWEKPGDVNEILDFYFRIQDPSETEPLYEAKLLIIGEGGAGKTSLAKKIKNENYKLNSDEESTEGIDVIQWKFPLENGKEFRVNIWDFGGQEIYHQTHQFFLSKRSLYVLVADTRTENPNFYWWMKVAELLSDNSPILIVKNEKQERQCEVNERQLRGEFKNLEKVLDNKAVIGNLGRFSQEELADIWNGSEYSDMQHELLQLMMQFKLCYPIPNNPGNYIAPQLLDVEEPNYEWDNSNNLILRYEYTFMPKGIITRFIVETHPFIEEQNLVWKSGVVLNKDQTRAEVIEYYNQRKIKIRVWGNRKKELLAVVTHELEKIHNSFERLKYQTLVPCNCKECLGTENPYTYPLDNLRKRLEKGRYEIECENSFEKVDVRRLIDDVNLSSHQEYGQSKVENTPLQQELETERDINFNIRSEKTNRGQILKKIRDAIIGAYPKQINLKMMVSDRLSENLDSISTGENLEEVVFELIKWAKSQNKLKQLVIAARKSNPGNTELQKISEEMN